MVTLDISQSEIVLVVLTDVDFKDLVLSVRILVSKLSIGVANIKKTKKNAVFVFLSLFVMTSGVAYPLLI
jgi:hypothetical protein